MSKLTVEFKRGMLRDTDMPDDDLEHVAFIGRSNVGKSSLINELMGQPVCRTSKTPGRTQQANLFLVNNKFYLVDLPGYGFAKLAQEQRAALQTLIEGYLGDPNSPLRRVFVVIDASVPFSQLDGAMVGFLLEHKREVVIAVNKWDKLNQKGQHATLTQLTRLYPNVDCVACSAKTGLGKADLLKLVL